MDYKQVFEINKEHHQKIKRLRVKLAKAKAAIEKAETPAEVEKLKQEIFDTAASLELARQDLANSVAGDIKEFENLWNRIG